ncbi:MAG TPA: isochorismatase family protein [Jatrophihabitans sp.]|jgi:nicotinamidase-related amidase
MSDLTTPYPWPWYGELDPTRLALVVVTSPQPSGDVTTLVDSIGAAAMAFRAAGAAVVEIRSAAPLAKRDQQHAARQVVLSGADSADHVIEPYGWDGFHGTPLDSILRAEGRDTLVLSGWWLEVAVHSTMRAGNDRGYECLLATDLVAGLDPTTSAGAISSIHMSGGIFGATGSGKSVVEALTTPSEETS